MKALVVFGTRFGWTEKTANVISSVLKSKGYVVDLSKGKLPKGIKDVHEYDLVIAGSSIMASLWKRGVKGFLKKYGGKAKKLYVFATAAGLLNVKVKEGKTKEEAINEAVQKYIEPLKTKFNLKIDGSTAFGGQMGKGEKIKFNNWEEKDIINWANGLV